MALAQEIVVLVHEWVTGGGLSDTPLPNSWEREGSAMRRAIAADFAALSSTETKVIMTLDARLPAEAGPWRVESIGPGQHNRKLVKLCRAADFTVLVAPETRGTLARVTRDLERRGVRILGSSAQAVELAGDKARLAVHFQSLGIPTPPSRTIVPSEGLPDLLEYPAVVKPVDGAGSVDTFYLDSPGDLSEEVQRMPQALLQPFVRGEPMSASLLVSCDGRAWPVAFGRQRMQLRNGRFQYDGGEIPASCPGAVQEVLRSVAAIEGLAGFVGVDFIWDDPSRRATILEVNPRPTTSVVGLCRLLPPGRLARAWLEVFRPPPRDDDMLESLGALVHTWKNVVFDTSGDFVDVSEAGTS